LSSIDPSFQIFNLIHHRLRIKALEKMEFCPLPRYGMIAAKDEEDDLKAPLKYPWRRAQEGGVQRVTGKENETQIVIQTPLTSMALALHNVWRTLATCLPRSIQNCGTAT
jgi:hypothetical protein